MGDPSEIIGTEEVGDWKYSSKASSVEFCKIGCVKVEDQANIGARGIVNDSKGILVGSSTLVDS